MTSKGIVLGLRENWQQFTLLIVVNAFVGAMIGLERTVTPLIAEDDFGLASKSAVLSFLISFGVVKALSNMFAAWLAAAMLLGLGTAMVYPTLLAAVSDVAHPTWRGSAVGVYRLWWDLGFAVGAILAGLLADIFNISVAIAVIGGLTFLSGAIVAGVMYETLPERRHDRREGQISGTGIEAKTR